MQQKITRRQTLKMLGKTGMALPFLGAAEIKGNRKEEENAPFEVHIFSKHLQWLDYENMAKTAAKIGFNGVDLTVRPKGHVLPENVEEDLPRAIEAIHKYGLKAELMTTSITGVNEPYTEKILKAASRAGIKKYRMGWLKYEEHISIELQLEKYKKQLTELVEMNAHYGLHGAYQNHAGTSVGASLWDTWLLVKDLNSNHLGARFDVRHATVEGMHSWKVDLRLLAPHIQSLDVKDFIWSKKEGNWSVENVPIGEGAVDFDGYFKLLNELKIISPITLHLEYPLGGADKGAFELNIAPEKVKSAMKNDLLNLKKYMHR